LVIRRDEAEQFCPITTKLLIQRLETSRKVNQTLLLPTVRTDYTEQDT